MLCNVYVFNFRQISGHPEQNVYATAFSPCDQFIVTGSGLGDLKVWDLTTFQVHHLFSIGDYFLKEHSCC